MTTAAAARPRPSVSIHDYPEHLNPFNEDDQHWRLRFGTLRRRLSVSRSSGINFAGIKELKNSWAFRSFMRKGKKAAPVDSSKTNVTESPVVYRRNGEYASPARSGARATVGGAPERPERYVYGGSVTPLPRSRFQERLRSPSQIEVGTNGYGTPRLARSDISGSRLSVESTNPFEQHPEHPEHPVPPVRASRRKKKRAPPPPGDVSITSIETVPENDSKINKTDDDLEDSALGINVELKIVEGEEEQRISKPPLKAPLKSLTSTEICENKETDIKENKPDILCITEDIDTKDEDAIVYREDPASKTSNLNDPTSFPKIDIIKYRRNSSLNEDDFRPKINNFERETDKSNQRSKSLHYDLNVKTYDINSNEASTIKDANDNEQPQKVVCKVYDSRKPSLDNSLSSTEREFMEIDKATRELEREMSKLNSALSDSEDLLPGSRMSVSEIRRKFDNNNFANPNPIPKPKRSNHGSSSPINGNYV